MFLKSNMADSIKPSKNNGPGFKGRTIKKNYLMIKASLRVRLKEGAHGKQLGQYLQMNLISLGLQGLPFLRLFLSEKTIAEFARIAKLEILIQNDILDFFKAVYMNKRQ